MNYSKIEFFNEFKMNEVNLMVVTISSGIADTMRNRTFHKTEDLVDLKNKIVKLSVIKKYCEDTISKWEHYSKNIQEEVVNKIIEDFERDKYEVDLEN